MARMEPSPQGRTIEYVEGEPDVIEDRGKAIKELGDQMLTSADVLEDIKNRGIDEGGQKGAAIDKLKESIGDSYEILREAGELYEPVGPVIETYGTKLRTAQNMITFYVDQAQGRWDTYDALPGEVEPRGTGGLFEPEEGSPEAEQNKEEDEAKKEAYDLFVESAESFDRWYGSADNEDSWEQIFDDAVSGITSGMSDSIKDSFWDAIGDFLSVAALVLGVVALFVGGWVIAAIALAVGALFLFVTFMQYLNGEKSLTDIAFAALGVLPIGKLSNLTKLAHGGRGLKAFGQGALGNIGKLQRANGFQRLGGRFFKQKPFTFNGKNGLMNALLGSGGPKAVHRDHMRLYFGPGGRAAFVGGQNAIRNISRIDFGIQFVANIAGWSGRVASAGGPGDPFPSWTGPLL